jgi:hypothetical protein
MASTVIKASVKDYCMLFFYMKRDFTLIPLAKALATAFDKVV